MRRRILPCGVCSAVVSVVALLLCVGMLEAAGRPGYARIVVSPRATIYLQFYRGEMRMAADVSGFQHARPVAAEYILTQQYWVFPQVTLPVPDGALPASAQQVEAQVTLLVRPDARTRKSAWYVGAWLAPARKDEQGTLWAYRAYARAPLAAAPDQAQELAVPDLAKLQAVVTAKEAKGKIGVGVQLKSGAAQITDIRKDGRSAPVVEVAVRDADGRVVASKRGPLTAFGFT